MADIYGQLVKAQFEHATSDLSNVSGLVYYKSDTGVLKFYDGVAASWKTLTDTTTAISNPMATTGDMIYGGAAGVTTKLATGATTGLLHGGNGAVPSWSLLVNADVHASAAIDGSKLVAASASVAGAVTTGAQDLAGIKTFTSQPVLNSGFTTAATSTSPSTVRRSSAGTTNTVLLVSKMDTTVASTRLIIGAADTGTTDTARGYVRVTAATTSLEFEATSDRRIKKDIVPMSGTLAKICALNPVTYKLREIGNDASGYGFIAQEFAEVFPSAVTKTDDGLGDTLPEGTAPWTMGEAIVIPYLVAAIKELKAEFDAYKASHP